MTHKDPLEAALLNDRVPRYTSYPPASRFSARVDGEMTEGWLKAMPDGAEVSLYVHVPFCRRLCYFCACRTQGTRSDAPLDRFLDGLEVEVAHLAENLPAAVKITALHLGGGTPTILSPDRLRRLSATLKAAFPLNEATEVSAEIDPTDCDYARLVALKELGLSRASIGVQDFDPKVQSAIGRQQSVDITEATVRNLRDLGVDSLNFDLLYGLPFQTPDSLAQTLDHVVALRPDRMALYGYAHVPWMARRQSVIPEAALPDSHLRVALNRQARARLVEAGYMLLGMDHYALPTDSMARSAAVGKLRRNFQGYTTDTAPYLLGMGPSAISIWPEGYSQNQPATGDWQRALQGKAMPTARGYVLTDRDRTISHVISEIMCRGRVDLSAASMSEAEVTDLIRRAERVISEMPGIANLNNAMLEATKPEYLRLLASQFDPLVEDGTQRYSVAS